MKKMLLFLFLMLLPVAIFAQEPLPTPGGLVDVVSNFMFWVSALAPLAGLTVFLTQGIINIFKITGKGLRQIVSWGTGFVLVVILGFLAIGLTKDLYWYGVLAYGVAVSLAANRAFDVKLLEGLLLFFKLRKPAPVVPASDVKKSTSLPNFKK